ncbi:MAG: DHH family phosphoesterase [Candidatus Auribacterota bacterium]|jgi:nanoRNase/pAp phosphatase (c-di-AMP/oligoRNAs hydrolase)|uniref:Phosphoesterase n=1 Tax=Candidatus Auribacter fodinae TaxID=2093366 RepID=A0A3A4R5K4_9BACT|nr:MAG: phosphoesterase [Candidatus Auribacter fodinae]
MESFIDGKIRELQNILSSKKSVVILMHDNPDPDAIASAWALHHLLKRRFGVNSIISYGGIIARAENKAMVKHLNIPLVPWNKIEISKHSDIALVDTQPGVGNNSLPSKITPLMVIDHHPISSKIKLKFRPAFYDIRDNVGATTSILYEYLSSCEFPIPKLLATAMFYGISSETRNLGREAVDLDQTAYIELFPHTSKRILANITHPKNTREYFAVLAHGLNTAMANDTTAFCHLGEVNHPDYIHQIADLMLTCENIRWSLCTGWWGPVLYLSLRATNNRAKAGVMVRKLVGSHGKAGGHDTMAGGKLEYTCQVTDTMRQTVESLISKRFARYCGRTRLRDYRSMTLLDKPLSSAND